MTDLTLRTPGTKPKRARRGFYDRDVQAIFWQVVVLALVIGLGAYLVRNTMINLETRHIHTGYGYLGRESGFDIGESLIPYSAANTYGRALLVGFLNTLHVAVIGVALATILGVFVGIGSLSKNWLLAKITAGYIHFLRNVPVLLQIILWYSLIINERFLPGPRQAEPFFGMYLTQRGFYFPVPVAHQGWFAGLVGLAVGVLAAWAVGRWAKRRQELTGVPFPAFWTGAFLIVALPVLAWAAFGAPTDLHMPQLMGFNIGGGGRITPEFVAVLFGLTVYTSAFIGEIVRAGILSVPKGQIEAARALGLREGVILRKITLPQALRVIIPPLTSQYLNLTKNSSLSVAIGYPDLVNVANTEINQTGQAIEGISIIMIVYLSISLATAALMNWYNKKKQLVER
ncbi:MAG TPA: amino acid ABC transporter permease [Hyphomicrobiaceae bacterium]|nr:amino acid ABC transporter permease [Hyphomicrobiaceae bacterium]